MHTQSGSLERWIFFSMSHNSSLQEKDLLRDWLVKALPYWPRWALLARCMHWAIQPIPIHCYLNTSTDSPEQGVGISYLNSSCRRDVLIGQFVGSVGCKVGWGNPPSANHIQTDHYQGPPFCLLCMKPFLNRQVLNLTSRVPWMILCTQTCSLPPGKFHH